MQTTKWTIQNPKMYYVTFEIEGEYANTILCME